MITTSTDRASSAQESAQRAPEASRPAGRTSIEVVDDQREPGAHEAGGEVSTQTPDADEADAHQPRTGSSAGVR